MATKTDPPQDWVLLVFVLVLGCLSIMMFGGELLYAMSN